MPNVGEETSDESSRLEPSDNNAVEPSGASDENVDVSFNY
jgi:hypothetical protein